MECIKRIWLTGLLCTTALCTLADEVIVNAQRMIPGEDCEITVELQNDNQVAACQLSLYLPEGLSLARDDAGRFVYTLSDVRKYDHVMTIVEAEDGSYLFAIYSPSNASLEGSDGELLKVTLKVDAAVDHTLQAAYKRIMTSTADGIGTKLPDVTFFLEMGTTTSVQTLQDMPDCTQQFYLLDGRQLEGVPSKKGLYVTNGRKLFVRSQ